MKFIKKILLSFLLLLSFLFSFYSHSFAKQEDYKELLSEVAENRAGEVGIARQGASGMRDLMINIGHKIILPILIVIGLIIAFVGFYKLAVTEKEDERKKGINYAIWGTMGIIVMVSAWFVTNTLVGETGMGGIMGDGRNYDGASIANRLYEQIFHKFFILALYFLIGILFIILLVSLIQFLTNPESEEIQKKGKTIFKWNAFGIIVIIFAKNIIETFYNKSQTGMENLGQNQALLAEQKIGWMYTILNYVLGFIAFVIAIFIIYQAFLLLMNPEDKNTYSSMKKYFVYSIIGVVLIGGVYLLANFFIIK